MAIETVAIQTASGATAYIAGDLVGTNFFPFSKLDVGADGVSSPVVTALPVTPSGALWPTAADQATLASSVGFVGETPSATAYATRTLSIVVDDPGPTTETVGETTISRIHQPSGGVVVAMGTTLDAGNDSVMNDTPTAQVWKSYNGSASFGAGAAYVLWDPTPGTKIRVTSLDISAHSTTGGRVMLFFGDDADLTYTAVTDQPLFVGSFAPSTTSKPGVVKTYTYPVKCEVADRRLHYQNDAAISVDITVYGYEE